MTTMLFGPQPYAEFFIRVGDEDVYGIDWTGWLSNQWQPGAEVTLTTSVVRPSIPNGFEALCIASGQTAAKEPQWPALAGAVVTDGSAQWQMQAASNASLTTTVQSVIWTPPTGISVSGQSLVGQVSSALINASAAVEGTDYVVIVTATMADNEIKIGNLKFKVR